MLTLVANSREQPMGRIGQGGAHEKGLSPVLDGRDEFATGVGVGFGPRRTDSEKPEPPCPVALGAAITLVRGPGVGRIRDERADRSVDDAAEPEEPGGSG